METKNVVAIGKFDGVHIGHRTLIETAAAVSQKLNMRLAVYVISAPNPKSITTPQRQERILRDLGADAIVRQELTEDFRSLSPEEFVDKILVGKLSAGYVVVGYNFRFGFNRRGDAKMLGELLSRHGVGITVIDSVNVENEPVSSTRIRRLIENGDTEMTKKCLGRYFCMWGTASEGKHLGAKIGFPTINFYPSSDALIPKHGVYVSKVFLDGKRYTGITNVGVNPTVEDGKNIKVETHIPSLETGKLYGKSVRIAFAEYIRGESKFESVEQLKCQLERDKKYALEKYGE